MKIYKLEIKNFRGVRNGEIVFGEHPVLIGANNTGKTTVIEALTLLLGRDKLIRDLTEHDFFGSTPQPADRIKLIATIIDFPGNDLDQNDHWFRDGRAIPKWLDLTNGDIHSTPDNEEWKLCCQIAAQAYFDYTSMSVEFLRYFHDHSDPIDPFVNDSQTVVPSQLIRELGFFLIRTNRTWDKILSWGSELFRRTINTTAAQPFESILAERDRLRNPELAIDQDPNISPLINNVNAEIGRCIPSSPSLKLRLTNTDSKSVMDVVSAHFSTEDGLCIPSARQGSGLISLQGLLLLLELGRVRTESGEEFTMALEEPELHLPPSTQQQIVHRLQSLSSQTFVTTHSPTIASMADPTSVILLRNIGGELKSEQLLKKPLNSNSPNWMRKFFQQSRAEVISALMHPFVLIPEGKTEYYLLNIIIRPLLINEGWITTMKKPFNLNVGIVPTEDAKVVETYEILKDIHQGVCCLVDGDVDGQRYAKSVLASNPRPNSILSWQQGAMIEDTIGWILKASPEVILASLNELSGEKFDSIDEVIIHLKAKKMDLIFYEHVADVIANNEDCRKHASNLFSSIAHACNNEVNDHFLQDESGIWVFKQ
ncbi:ATP-dependent nuclease [Teredinibacter purpureus]|uniref:ATP-dependent nuclease n=1 Tax=Teredinibacter purpureus TaxID=2731756 RepID=UPI0005F7F7E6|nr:AAA family ATPase [Teredinibacter purpureus]